MPPFWISKWPPLIIIFFHISQLVSHIEHRKWCEYLYVCDARDYAIPFYTSVISGASPPSWIFKWPPTIIIFVHISQLVSHTEHRRWCEYLYLWYYKIILILFLYGIITGISPPFWISKWLPLSYLIYRNNIEKKRGQYLYCDTSESIDTITVLVINGVRPTFSFISWSGPIYIIYIFKDLAFCSHMSRGGEGGGGGALPYWRWTGTCRWMGMILRSSILAQGILWPSCGHQ